MKVLLASTAWSDYVVIWAPEHTDLYQHAVNKQLLI